MRVLLIKTSSMGDVVHALPALTDAGRAIPGIQFEWVVEEAFAEIPAWHPLVKQVIPVSLRQWRKNLFSQTSRHALSTLRQKLAEQPYDLILDAQGLVKSAFLCFFARGERVGLDFHSARETLAALAYQRRIQVNFYQHAVVRMRLLFSQAFGYALPTTAPDFGMTFKREGVQDNIVFLHGTTWASKQWPEKYWIELARMLGDQGYRVSISGGSEEELARAVRIAAAAKAVAVLPRLSIAEMAGLLVQAKAAVAVDTGFGHLAAALNVPTVSLYGSTNPTYTGAVGLHSLHLAADFPCSPCLKRVCAYREASEVKPACYGSILPGKVFQALQELCC